ncbi:MAG TPA: phosphotransferase [Polyangiaceae bacterium]|jgi:2-polyprenyl-3-methyl-5-hydroxy-6-metoxy-1,4-benzoquinol methylase|nr:phosphotransferase [Polyangiaceae bacterium]
MDGRLRRVVERVTGKVPVSWQRVSGGYTPAARFRVLFADQSSAFVKVGTTPMTADALRSEARRYAALHASFMPNFIGFEDDSEQPLLVLEDLSSARWPPPWQSGDVARLAETLGRVAKTRPLPSDLPSLAAEFSGAAGHGADQFGWQEVERDSGPFLSLGLCSSAWLFNALPRLLEAERSAVLDGDDLVHGDVRSDNLCFSADRLVLVDWNMASRGNAAFDLAFAAPSIRLEGGPLPEEIVGRDAGLAAIVSGFFAARAGLEFIPDAPRVRWIQARQLRIALPWIARVLELPAPDLHWARTLEARVNAEHARAEIDDRTWHEQIEEIIGDLYLASADPRAQSGRSGDEVEWRWARELVLDALPNGGSLLDIGCANGYLLESFERWSAERGTVVELHGLDISARLASLARQRLPGLAARIWVGNASNWEPPRRFDLVHTGLDYVPVPQRRVFLARVLADLVAPGGRVVIRAERVVPGVPDLVKQVEEIGFTISGVLERRHPTSNELRRTAWLDKP